MHFSTGREVFFESSPIFEKGGVIGYAHKEIHVSSSSRHRSPHLAYIAAS